MTPETRNTILAYLDAAEIAIAAARAALAQFDPPLQTKTSSIESAILRALRNHPGATMAELTEETDYELNRVSACLTKLTVAGKVTRERIRRDGSQREYYAYRLA